MNASLCGTACKQSVRYFCRSQTDAMFTITPALNGVCFVQSCDYLAALRTVFDSCVTQFLQRRNDVIDYLVARKGVSPDVAGEKARRILTQNSLVHLPFVSGCRDRDKLPSPHNVLIALHIRL